MRIEVTAEDIMKGTPMNCNACPIALALHRATGRRWEVHSDMIQLTDAQGEHVTHRPLPDGGHQFIADFDDGKPVWPFAFDFDPVVAGEKS